MLIFIFESGRIFEFGSFGVVLSRKYLPYFVAGIRATSCATFRPNTTVATPTVQGFAEIVLQWRNCEVCEALLRHRKKFLR